MKVMVYRNLHKKVWSVRVDGKVVKHAASLTLTDCTFKVWEGGRQRVIREQKKFVHAFAVGVEGPMEAVTENMRRVSYNPYLGRFFYEADTKQAVFAAGKLVFTETGQVFAELTKTSDN